jgi:hypothetical protein
VNKRELLLSPSTIFYSVLYNSKGRRVEGGKGQDIQRSLEKWQEARERT